jgi:hypothetical protein
VLAGVVGLGEEAGGLDDDVDAEVAPRAGGRVALGEHLHGLPGDLDASPSAADVLDSTPRMLSYLSRWARTSGLVRSLNRHDLDVLAAGRGGPPEVAADPAEPVDPHPYGHS